MPVYSKTERLDGSVRTDYTTKSGACRGSVLVRPDGSRAAFTPSGNDFSTGHGHMEKNAKGKLVHMRSSSDPKSLGRKFK